MEFALAWAAMSAIFQGFSMFEKADSANARIKSLELQSKASTIRHQQELLSNYDILERTLSTQLAEASARGVGIGSLSFEAIERDTINRASKEERTSNLEESLFQKGINIEKSNVKKSLYASLFGDVANAGFNALSFSKSMNK